jgi:hypothetical protein
MVLRLAEQASEMQLRMAFQGITLTPDQEAIARSLITKAEEDIRANRPPAPVRHLRLNPAGTVTMPTESAQELIALISNDDDRAKVQARIAAIEER